jgi:septal ring factor EnvC (AmiA/AmiB activator)
VGQIKTVTYERLFSLTNYNNEKISLTASLDDGVTNADKVLGSLFLKVTEIHKFFAYFRTVLGYIENCRSRLEDAKSRLANVERAITEQKITLAELQEHIKKGDLDDARMRHACAGSSLQTLNDDKRHAEEYLASELKREKELHSFIAELQKHVKDGNLTLEGIDCPSMRLDTQDDE